MKAAFYSQFGGPISIEEVNVPHVPDHGALVRVTATGICRSDWHGWQGNDPDINLPHVPGHEFAGVIESVGSGVSIWTKGQRVTSPFACGCGACPECERGSTQVCRNQTQPGFTHWGSWAEYVVVMHADTNLAEIPADMPDEHAAVLGCRFGTAYRAVCQQGGASIGQKVAVFGCGGVGLSAVMIANALGAEVIAVDINDEKLAKATTLGASHCINLQEEDFSPDAIRLVTGGGADICIDAIGNQRILGLGLLSLRAGGRHVQVGLLNETPTPPIPAARIISEELELKGSHGLSAFDYKDLFNFISNHQLDLGSLITDTVTLDRGIQLMTHMDSQPPLGMAVIKM